jgi:hypothetical protein
LLELRLTEGQKIADVNGRRPPARLPSGFTIRCFESNDASIEVLNISAGRVALLAVLEACAKNLDNKENKEMKYSAVWPRMQLRVSSNEEDLVHSVSHLLGVKLECDKILNLHFRRRSPQIALIRHKQLDSNN